MALSTTDSCYSVIWGPVVGSKGRARLRSLYGQCPRLSERFLLSSRHEIHSSRYQRYINHSEGMFLLWLYMYNNSPDNFTLYCFR